MKKIKKKQKKAILTRFMAKKAFHFIVKWILLSMAVAMLIIMFLVIKTYWNLSFGLDSPELGIFLGILLLISWIMLLLRVKKKKKNTNK